MESTKAAGNERRPEGCGSIPSEVLCRLSRARLARDALAGLTLASKKLPQVLGYTRIAGTPVITGPYTVLLPLVGFAVFGSSRHHVVAADSATAAIFASSLSRMAPFASEKYMTLVGMLTLLIAGFSSWGFSPTSCRALRSSVF